MNYAAETTTELKRLRDEIKRGAAQIVSLSGLTSIAAKAFVLSKLKSETDSTFVIVADSNKDSDTWECDLNFWQNLVQSSKFKVQSQADESKIQNLKSKISTLPSFESDVYANVSPHTETLEKRAFPANFDD